MFDADRPITNSAQDRLGRNVFAKYLARCILDHQSPESLVIGLSGGWGTGKTSLINLTLEELRFASSNMLDNEKPIILNFSPWSYSGQGQLIYSFFRRLSSEIRRADYFEDSEKIIHLLELYVSFFTHQPVPKPLRPKHNVVARMTKAKLIKEETYGWESGRDLTLVKAELNELLSKQKHKIIIFIDNIARLDDGEIKQVFQIVKSIGDYANTVYVLAIDKTPIIYAMNKLHGTGGEEYLNKVIQLSFDVPEISHGDVETILLDKLKHLVKLAPEDSWEKDYWADIYYSTLKYFFHTCRDITQYVNTLSFSFVHVKDVVNPVDFFAITALAVFSPDVYDGIRDNKDLFTDLIENVLPPDEKKLSEDKLRCDEILNRPKKISTELMQQLLVRLFPRLRAIYQPKIAFHHDEAAARKNHRICSADVFDAYFRLSIPVGYIAKTEMNALLALTHDEQGFALALLRLNQDERISKFLDLLDSEAVHNIPEKNIQNVLYALMDDADLFPEGEDTVLSFNTPMRIHRIIHQLLLRIPTSEQRFEIFREAIKKTINSLYIIVHELNVQKDFSPEHLAVLQKLAVGKISYWAEIGRLAEHPKLLAILYAWKAWGNEDDCTQFVSKMVLEDRGLIAFLSVALKEPIDQAMTNLSKNPEWEQSLVNINNFISAKLLEAHAKMIFESSAFEELREREQLAILIFLDLINAKTMKVIMKPQY